MMHPQIEEQDIVERYVRDQLSPQDREAFEEHYFSCEECFGKVEIAERFVAGIRDAGKKGLLVGESGESTGGRRSASWWLPAFGLSSAVALLAGVVAGWLYFVQVPRIRSQFNQSQAALRSEEKARAALETERGQDLKAEANVPLVILQTERGVPVAAEAVLPADAGRLILWIDAVPASYPSYRLEVYNPKNEVIETLRQLTRNKYGALAASLPAARLQSGEFRIKLLGEKNRTDSLLEEFTLNIRRK